VQDVLGWLTVAVLATMFSYSVPLVFASLGEAVSERSGVYNLGLEGYMLAGAFFGYYFMVLSDSLLIALFFGALAGLLLSLVHAFLTITLRLDQIIIGIALWFFSMGLTTFLYRAMGSRPSITTLRPLDLGFLGDIPWLGTILFNQNALVYFGFLLVVLITVLLNYSPLGLLIKATGDNPLAIDTAGYNVFLIRYVSVLMCGALAGLGGAYLPLVLIGSFTENMTAGRGFIALAIVIFGKWVPWKILLGSFLFAGIQALQLRLQAIGVPVPYPFLLMLPYIVTIVIMIAFMRKGEPPEKLAIPYTKGE